MNEQTAAAPAATITTTREAPADATLLASILARVDAIAVQQSRPSPVKLTTWAEIERFAEKAARSKMVPSAYQGKPDDIVIAVQMGSELGLAPMQSLQNIASINGRPSVWGDAMPGLCRASGKVDYIKEWATGEGDALVFHCEAKRKDDPNPISSSFSVADAKKAGLWGKAGPWQNYPLRMLQMRARGFCLRDAFPDVLRGLISAEEAADIPFEATGLTLARVAVEPIPNEEPPPAKPVRTWAMLLAEIEADFHAATSYIRVDELIASDTVQNALDKATGKTADKLNSIIQAAIARHPDPNVEPAMPDIEETEVSGA